MRLKHLLSLFMLSMGVALLVAAMVAGGAMSATRSHTAVGGTENVGLFNGAGPPISTLDPQIAYDTGSWTVLNATSMNLVAYPDNNGLHAPLQLQAATAFPTFRSGGKQVTWHVKSGLKFNDGTAVTAASFQRAIERSLSPCMYGNGVAVNDFFDKLIKGGVAYNHAACNAHGHISGVQASGQNLVINLTRPAPYFTAAMAMMWFDAVPADTPMNTSSDPNGATESYPSAGPYFISSATPLGNVVAELHRNPFYNGPRAANPNVIKFVQYSSQQTCYNDTTSGSPTVDVDLCGLTSAMASTATSQLGASTTTGVPGAAAGGGTQFHVEQTGCVDYLALNTQTAPTTNVKVRQAIAWALDKSTASNSLLKILGLWAGTHSEQVLTPAIPGYKHYNSYGTDSNFAKAIQVAAGALNNKSLSWWHSGSSLRTAQAGAQEAALNAMSSQYNLNLTVHDVTTTGNYFADLGDKANATGPGGYNIARAGWCADYYDPFDYINVLLDGSNIPAQNGVNLAYLNNSSLNHQMEHAATLAGAARKLAYEKLDKTLIVDQAAWLPYEIVGARFVVASNVGNYTWNGFLTSPALNAISVQ
jgi:peptide/nickel transport system substrate-binding protein